MVWDTGLKNMIKNKWFLKYVLIGTGLVFLFVVMGVYFSGQLSRMVQTQPERVPPLFFAKLVDKLGGDNKLKGIRELQEIHREGMVPRIFLVDKEGTLLSESDTNIQLNWKGIRLPQKVYDYIKIQPKDILGKEGQRSVMPPSPPPEGSLFKMGPNRPPGPPGRNEVFLVRLDGDLELYLLIKPPRPPMGKRPEGLRWIPVISVISLLVSLIIGVGLTVRLIYDQVHSGVEEADRVIGDIRKGNLKARFDVKRKDEFGHAMSRFNIMADEVEGLVNHLRDSEEAKSKLLQELAHDLRTPVASLKSLLETLKFKSQKLDESVKEEFVDLSLKEVDYFGKLVEDLLFLAQMEDPGYGAKTGQLDIVELIESEARDSLKRSEVHSSDVKLQFTASPEEIYFSGDAHVLRRLFRNAFENGFSFAQSQVSVEVLQQDEKLCVKIWDDGPGFPDQVLEEFGAKRISRKLDASQGGRISVGLGGLVMSKICGAYRGKLNVSNGDKPVGAIVSIELPLA